MIILTSTTDKIQAVLGANVTTNQLQCVSSWRDITTTAYTPGRTLINTNNTTDVDIVDAPGASTQRVIDRISIYNNDTVAAVVTVKFDANGTEYILWKGTLAVGQTLLYSEGTGWTLEPSGRTVVALSSGTTNLTTGDSGKEYYFTGAASLNLPASALCTIGREVYYFFNDSAASPIIDADGTNTLAYMTDGDLRATGVATVEISPGGYGEIRYIASGVWRITGRGISEL